MMSDFSHGRDKTIFCEKCSFLVIIMNLGFFIVVEKNAVDDVTVAVQGSTAAVDLIVQAFTVIMGNKQSFRRLCQ